MKVKICGLKEAQHIEAAVNAGVDYIGFVFANSSRQVTKQEAKNLSKVIPKEIKKVGVFVNASLDEIQQTIMTVPLDYVQLHGNESVEFANQIPVPVIKAFSIKNGELPENIMEYKEHMILLDAPAAEFEGGSGKKFEWNRVNTSELKMLKLIIAGGLNERNVQDAIQYFNPYGVDVSSGVETNNRKDSRKIKTFIKNAKGE